MHHKIDLQTSKGFSTETRGLMRNKINDIIKFNDVMT